MINNLRLKEPVVLTQSFNRPNLFYEVRKKEKGFLEQIANIVKKDHAGQPGIIYCLSKKNCEDVANQLRKQYSVRAMHYHAGMEKDDRKRVQTEWQNGKFQVICATIAFGMGIDSLVSALPFKPFRDISAEVLCVGTLCHPSFPTEELGRLLSGNRTRW